MNTLGIPKNYRGIFLTSITAKVYNVQLLIHIEPEIKKILWKNQNSFRRNRSTTSQILTVCRILEDVSAKNNTKIKVRSPDGDNEFFDIVSGVLEEDAYPINLFIICLDSVPRTSIDLIKENGFILKATSGRYFAETITYFDYAGNIALLTKNLLKPNVCIIVSSRHQEALVSTRIRTKWSTCVLIKATFLL